ncbi:hypothetical protein [Rheinheimera sp.]|uniref:hypothetical protein n=1 Tax=Rheinheimera sp. TaxID=1869214 RepID=UPI004047C7C1
MRNQLKLSIALASLLAVVAACSDNTTELPHYKITEDTVKGSIKRTVEVELSARTDEATLQALAKEIHGLSDANVERTFIGYRLANDKNQGYWATTHYNPNLEVQILGESASDYEKIKNTASPSGEVIGSWMANWGYEYKMTAYNKDGKTYIQSVYSDGTSSDKVYEQSQSDKGIKLQDEGGKERAEYYIINQKGELEFWSENGNYYTAPKS